MIKTYFCFIEKHMKLWGKLHKNSYTIYIVLSNNSYIWILQCGINRLYVMREKRGFIAEMDLPLKNDITGSEPTVRILDT
jgi:hypothetical protein